MLIHIIGTFEFMGNSKLGWAMRLGSRDLGQGIGLIVLGRFGLGQISLGQSRDKNLWDSQIQISGTKLLGNGSPVPCPSLILTKPFKKFKRE